MKQAGGVGWAAWVCSGHITAAGAPCNTRPPPPPPPPLSHPPLPPPQLLALNSEVRGQEAKLAAAQAALHEAVRLGSELRGQVAMLGDELSRANAERAAAQGAIERLGRAVSEGQAASALEARRQLDEQAAGFRAELMRRQQQHLEVGGKGGG